MKIRRRISFFLSFFGPSSKYAITRRTLLFHQLTFISLYLDIISDVGLPLFPLPFAADESLTSLRYVQRFRKRSFYFSSESASISFKTPLAIAQKRSEAEENPRTEY